VLAESTPYWQLLEVACAQMAREYGYRQIRLPIVEQTDLFDRTIGHATDIIEKEMYTFTDRNGVSLSLRPEGTAGCVRAGIEHGLFYNQVQRLWYMGPMFRHERPQKGRYRQFHQFGLEAFGMPGPHVDAEHMLMCAGLWKKLGISEHIKLEINSLGNIASRANYRKVLVDYFQKNRAHLDEDSVRRLETNPLRILDTKNPALSELVLHAPKITEHLDAESLQHFEKLCALLDEAKLSYTVNPKIVRGLDYYQLTVYEWITTELGAQGTVCAGGRYDTLVEQLGGKPTTAVGFAMGLERLVLIIEQAKTLENKVDIYFVLAGEAAMNKGLQVAEELRLAIPGIKIETNLVDSSFKSQFKKADKSGARFAFTIAEDELAHDKITVKYLREEKPQELLSVSELVNFLHHNKGEK
jgi:histidyl-tRNA synthetase